MHQKTIKDEGTPKPTTKKTSLVDIQDVLIVLGIGLVETGLAKIYVPSAYIVGGLFCFAPFIVQAFTNRSKD